MMCKGRVTRLGICMCARLNLLLLLLLLQALLLVLLVLLLLQALLLLSVLLVLLVGCRYDGRSRSIVIQFQGRGTPPPF